MLTGVFLKTHSRKRAQPHYQSASGTLSAASIRWALKRVRQGPSPVPAPGWGRTVAGNPGCPGGCQRLSALPRRSAACRCVPVRKGSLSPPLSAEESSLHPQFHFPTLKPKPWNHRIVWVGNASEITESSCSPSSAQASTKPHPQMPHPHGSYTSPGLLPALTLQTLASWICRSWMVAFLELSTSCKEGEVGMRLLCPALGTRWPCRGGRGMAEHTRQQGLAAGHHPAPSEWHCQGQPAPGRDSSSG